jgi:hypothetical protein
MENFPRVDTNVIANQLALSNQLMSKLVGLMSALFPRSVGTFTCAAAASTNVVDTNATASSIITLMPLNASAGTLVGSAKSFYFTRASGSFTVTTANGVAALGTEQFAYAISNPL